MNAEKLEAIKARAAAATPGPWEEANASRIYKNSVRMTVAQIAAYGELACTISRDCRRNDAKFIAHARADIPALVAEVERLRVALEHIQNWSPESTHSRRAIARYALAGYTLVDMEQELREKDDER